MERRDDFLLTLYAESVTDLLRGIRNPEEAAATRQFVASLGFGRTHETRHSATGLGALIEQVLDERLTP